MFFSFTRSIEDYISTSCLFFYISSHPVSGGYSNWSVGIPCNVSCGEGVEVWQRTCDNPEPKYGGHNCSELGELFELRKCKREPCPSKDKIIFAENST